MSKISIITDSDSSLPVQIAKELGIIQVPILIQFGEQSYATGIDITDDLLFQIIDQKRTLPTTSAPSPNAFYDAFKDAFDLGADQVICICVSSSLNLTMAQGFIAIIAAEKVKQGANKAEVLKAIEETKSKVHVYGVLPTLKYLAMGGRMSKLAAGVADTLTIKPILTSRNGKLDLLEKVRTIRKAQERLVELAGECTQGKKVERIAMIHTNNVPDAQDLFEKIKTSLQIELSPIMAEFSAGLSVHAGDGMIGFVILTD
jgi:fatty acid-binding protein DegV